jgi:hypothetical protein
VVAESDNRHSCAWLPATRPPPLHPPFCHLTEAFESFEGCGEKRIKHLCPTSAHSARNLCGAPASHYRGAFFSRIAMFRTERILWI